MENNDVENREVSVPGQTKRYRYLVVLVIVIILLFMLHGRRVFKFNLNQIKWKGLIIYIVISLILLMIFNAYCEKKTVIEQEDLDKNWSFLHACFYFGLAYFIPNNWPIILTLMVLWEVIEDFIGFRLRKKSFVEVDKKKMQDIACNSLGYYLGNLAFRRNK